MRGTWLAVALCLVSAPAIESRARGDKQPDEGAAATPAQPAPEAGAAQPAPAAEPAPAVTGAVAATGGVRGRVLDGGQPVAGAMVVREGTYDGAVTGADGSFAIDGLPAGRQRLVIEAAGYQTMTVTVDVRAGGVVKADANLAAPAVVGEEIVITGTRAPVKRLDSPVNVEMASEADIRRSGGVSYLAALASMKGIDHTTSGVSDQRISARGFTTQFNSRMLTMLDGRLATLPGNGLPQANLLPSTPLDMKSVEVVVGPASALYGPNAHTGVVNVLTKTPWDQSGVSLVARAGNQDLLGGATRVAGTVADRLGYKVNAEYMQATDFAPDRDERVTGVDGITRSPHFYGTDTLPGATPVFEGDLVGDYDVRSAKADGNLYYRFGDWQAKGSAGWSDTDGFSLTNAGRNHLRGWQVNYQAAELVGPSWYAQVTRTASDAGESYQLNRLAANVAAMGGADALTAEELEAQRDMIEFIDNSQMMDAELQHHRTFGPLRATAGAQYRIYLPSSEGTYLSDADESISASEIGGYGQLDLPLLDDRLRLVGAGRVDHHSNYSTQVSPSAAVVYSVAPLHNVRVSYNRAFKSPTILENYLLINGTLVGNKDGFEIRNGSGEVVSAIDGLEPEQVNAVEVGYKGVVASRLFVDAVAYNSWYENFISPLTQVANPAPMDPAVEPTYAFYPDGTPVGAGTPAEGTLFTYMNFGAATVRGADLGATYLPIDGLELQGGLSLIQLASFDNDTSLQKDLLLNVPTFKLKGALTVSGLGFDDYFVKVSGRYKNRHDFESGYWSTARFGQVPASVITDLSAGYDFPRQGLTLTATVANLFDSQDVDVLGAPIPGRLAFLQLGYNLDALAH